MSEVLPRRNIKRVERTFAFLDLCGFTAFTDRHGDEDAYDVVAGFRSAVRQVAAERGVRIAKWLGDGVMMVGVLPEELVEAVVDIEGLVDEAGSPLAMRAGIARGPTMLIDGDDHVGPAVILASRLCDMAEPHQVLAEAGTVDNPYMANVEEEPHDLMAVDGFERKVDVVRLVPPGGDVHGTADRRS